MLRRTLTITNAKYRKTIGTDTISCIDCEINGQKSLFGRNKYMSSVIVNADEKNLGKIVSVKIERSNQNSLFGETNFKNKFN